MRVVKDPLANVGDIRDVGLIPGLGRSPGEGNGNPSQYSCLKNPMERGAWWATVHRVAKSWTQLKGLNHHHKDTKQQNAASSMLVKLRCVRDIKTGMCVFDSHPSDAAYPRYCFPWRWCWTSHLPAASEESLLLVSIFTAQQQHQGLSGSKHIISTISEADPFGL